MLGNPPVKANSLETSGGSSSRRGSAQIPEYTTALEPHHSPLDRVAINVADRAARHDAQLKELDTKLRENLSNFRAIEGSIKDTLAELKKTEQKAEHALDTDTPRLREELERSLVVLQDLSHTLPRIRSRVANIRSAYDSGRKKAQDLVNDLMWLNTDFHERWRRIIFTSSTPVSWRWKATMRLLFCLTLLVVLRITWLIISGVYRAHRQRLLWGERLMS
ncbi:hypothetical protein ID866_6712 [Astraeus odoratus]|nr:hypothetical protein ID866_6712 [Astraeus odoratus]